MNAQEAMHDAAKENRTFAELWDFEKGLLEINVVQIHLPDRIDTFVIKMQFDYCEPRYFTNAVKEWAECDRPTATGLGI